MHITYQHCIPRRGRNVCIARLSCGIPLGSKHFSGPYSSNKQPLSTWWPHGKLELWLYLLFFRVWQSCWVWPRFSQTKFGCSYQEEREGSLNYRRLISDPYRLVETSIFITWRFGAKLEIWAEGQLDKGPYRRIPVTCRLSPVTCHLSLVSRNLSPVACLLSPVTPQFEKSSRVSSVDSQLTWHTDPTVVPCALKAVSTNHFSIVL